jgi:hypothetical protein
MRSPSTCRLCRVRRAASRCRQVLFGVRAVEIHGRHAVAKRAALSAGRRLGPNFVGRKAEVEQLRGAVDETLGARGSLIMLVGEPGIGKTRMAEEVGTYAAVRSVMMTAVPRGSGQLKSATQLADDAIEIPIRVDRTKDVAVWANDDRPVLVEYSIQLALDHLDVLEANPLPTESAKNRVRRLAHDQIGLLAGDHGEAVSEEFVQEAYAPVRWTDPRLLQEPRIGQNHGWILTPCHPASWLGSGTPS